MTTEVLMQTEKDKVVHGENFHSINEIYPFSLTYHFSPNSMMISFPKSLPMPISSHFPSESHAMINMVMKFF